MGEEEKQQERGNRSKESIGTDWVMRKGKRAAGKIGNRSEESP